MKESLSQGHEQEQVLARNFCWSRFKTATFMGVGLSQPLPQDQSQDSDLNGSRSKKVTSVGAETQMTYELKSDLQEY